MQKLWTAALFWIVFASLAVAQSTLVGVGGSGDDAAFGVNLLSMGRLPAGMTLTRSDVGTVYDATGRMTYSPNNLFVDSQNQSTANWNLWNIKPVTAAGVNAPSGAPAYNVIPLGNNIPHGVVMALMFHRQTQERSRAVVAVTFIR